MNAIGIVYGYFCINAAIWSLSILAAIGVFPSFGREPIINPTDMGAMFSLNTFTVVTGFVGGAAIGILALVTRNVALGGGVLVLWIVGIIIKPIQDIFIGLPLLIQRILPPEIWFVSQIVVAFAGFIFFIFIVEVILGRQIL